LSIHLNKIERRVLGVLMEKAMTQPDYYPMTSNAIVAACNQKSNRDPIMNLDEATVLVSLVLPAPGARTNRHKHEADKVFDWSKHEKAVMTELLLRGPQTAGELRGRCSRMAIFESIEIVSNVLESLSQKDPPMTAPLPREPGRSAIRHTHLLYPEDEEPPTPHAPASAPAATSAGTENAETLKSRIETLENEVTKLREQMENINQRLKTLEGPSADHTTIV